MALDPEQGVPIADDVSGPYAAVELLLLEKMAEHLAVGLADSDWSQRQLVERLKFRNEAVRLQRGMQVAMPPRMGEAIRKAAVMGRGAADRDLVDNGAAPRKGATRHENLPPHVERRALQAANEVASFTGMIANNADNIYVQVKMRVEAVGAGQGGSADNLRRQAVQQALDILTARGITGFRDNAGRNWSLSTYMEMKSRTLVNQQLIDSHTERMVERGYNFLVVSSHARSAPQCQPFEGQVLSLDGTTGTVTRPNAAGPGTVTVKIKATLKDARAQGFQHPNCRHAVSSWIPGASRTFTTEPDPKGYADTQRLRAMERAIRETKRKRAIAVDPGAKRRLSDTLRQQQAAAQKHRSLNNLNKRPQRERVDLGYDIGDIDPKGVMPPKLPKTTPDAPSVVPKPAAASTRLSADTLDLIERARATLPKDRAGWLDTTLRYPKDNNGAKLIPEKLAGHLTSTMQVGQAIRRDTAKQIRKDTQLTALRKEEKSLLDAGKYLSPRRTEIQRDIAQRERAIIQDTLSDVRRFGGVQQTARVAAQGGKDYEAGSSAAIDLVRGAETIYPTDWLRAADSRGPLVIGSSERAFFRRGSGDRDDLIASTTLAEPYYRGAFSSYAEETMAHELGHRMESLIPGLTHLEYAFVRSRSIKDGTLEPTTPIFDDPNLSDEVGFADEWSNRYAGKTYAEGMSDPATSSAEVFQVGIEDTFGREHHGRGGKYDKTGELQEFVMGALALL